MKITANVTISITSETLAIFVLQVGVGTKERSPSILVNSYNKQSKFLCQ